MITPAAGTFTVATFGVDTRGFTCLVGVVGAANGVSEDGAMAGRTVDPFAAEDVGTVSAFTVEFDFSSDSFAVFAVDNEAGACGGSGAVHAFTLYRIQLTVNTLFNATSKNSSANTRDGLCGGQMAAH